MKFKLTPVLKIAILLVACLVYLYFTGAFEGLEIKSFDTVSDKEIKNGNAINDKGIIIGGLLPGSPIPDKGKNTDCIIVTNSGKFLSQGSPDNAPPKHISGTGTNPTTNKPRCGILKTDFTSKKVDVSNKIKTGGNLVCINSRDNNKYICHTDKNNNATTPYNKNASSFYKVSIK
jgi:hypothetical protein